MDGNRTRRVQLAAAFRAAGCVVVDTSKEHEVTRTLADGTRPWVLVVADGALTLAYRDAHPTVPIVQLGSEHYNSIAGRITVDGSPHLGAEVHALVPARTVVS
jgi:hypothetical protein